MLPEAWIVESNPVLIHQNRLLIISKIEKMDVYCGTFPSHKSKTVSIHKIQGTAGTRIIKNEYLDYWYTNDKDWDEFPIL